MLGQQETQKQPTPVPKPRTYQHRVYSADQLGNIQATMKKSIENSSKMNDDQKLGGFVLTTPPPSITERHIRLQQPSRPPLIKKKNTPSEQKPLVTEKIFPFKQIPLSSSQKQRDIGHEQTTTQERTEDSTEYYKGFVAMGYQHFQRNMPTMEERTVPGERTATAERFREQRPFIRDNDWLYGRGPVVYHWHPPPPSFRNVRRLNY
jgi:hypothetical protein